MPKEFPSHYNPKEVEEKIYRTWEDSGFFNPDNLPNQTGKPFTIIMPPPNANAPLHVGHALGITIEDILIRFHRMRGRRVLWLPGTDHAGFETQVVFEKKLEKEGRSRFKMEREEFYKEISDFVEQNKHISEEGIRRLGASCDWSRNMFTLDSRVVKIVYETFKKMHEDGLVYRGDRIGNWCSKHQTTLSDLETKYEEREEPLYYLKYGPFVIATARPETKFGDKYVVMHPEDERYAKYKQGDKIELEWINGVITATIIKDEAIDVTFGTGVMTITPWHDPIDFEIAQRHNLDGEQIIDKYGKLLPITGEFSDMKIAAARPLIVEKLKQKGLLEKIETNYKHSVQVCYKCGTVIEPQIIPQWFVAMTKPLPGDMPSLRDMALDAISKKEIVIVPDRFEKVFAHWMENIRDWPISRQIWWGIPIPVWYHEPKCIPRQGHEADIVKCEEIVIAEEKPACKFCDAAYVQDIDTFDTWFSSGQWPYAALQAHGEKNFQTYFPTQIMETGWDILFFWVARMIMFSYYRTGEKPFETVYLHGLVRDKDRQKMSKSKGNVIDPLGVIDIYGTDALRFALVFSTAAGNDIPLSEDKIRGMKHFANKLWNVTRFVLANTDGEFDLTEKPSAQSDADKEILIKLDETIMSATKNLEALAIHEAAQSIYHFTWHEFADKYVEHSKEQLKNDALRKNTQGVLVYCLANVTKVLHPFMPFITEEIWSHLPLQNKSKKIKDKNNLLMIQPWPDK